MNLFAIGDLHLSYSKHKPMDLFGVHWKAHEEKIKKQWEELVTDEDVVLIPGDISWAMRLKEATKDLEWLEQLPGKKICIKGNHDYWWDRTGILNKLYKSLYFLQNTAYWIGDLAICGTRGWALLNPDMRTEADEKMIHRECIRLKLSLEEACKKGCREIWVLLHYPPCGENQSPSPFIELMKQYPVKRVIYGHLHDEAAWKKALIGNYDGISYHLVSADYLGFRPFWIDQVVIKTEGKMDRLEE